MARVRMHAEQVATDVDLMRRLIRQAQFALDQILADAAAE